MLTPSAAYALDRTSSIIRPVNDGIRSPKEADLRRAHLQGLVAQIIGGGHVAVLRTEAR